VTAACDNDARRALEAAVLRSNDAVHAAQTGKPELTGMATTLTAAVLRDGGRVVIAHVGDSRAYAVTPGGLVRQLTDDHSLVGELVRSGKLSPEEASTHPHRNVITRALGNETDLAVDSFVEQLAPGEWLLLCSDGLTGHVEDHELGHIVRDTHSPQAATSAMVALANERGGTDNISVVLAQPLRADEAVAGQTASLHPTEVSGELDVIPIEATDVHEEGETTAAVPRAAPGWRGSGGGGSGGEGAPADVATTQTFATVPPASGGRGTVARSDAAPAADVGAATEPVAPARRPRSRYLRTVLVILFLSLAAFTAGAVAWRQSYFLTEHANGSVAIDQGFPLLGLHRSFVESDVQVEDLEPADRERFVESETLRSREDARRLLERMRELAGQCEQLADTTTGAGVSAAPSDPDC